MSQHGPKKIARERMSIGGVATIPDERRGVDRHIFTASAEVMDLGSGARFSARTTDLGPGGCFLDTLISLPVGSRVHVTVRKDKTQLETYGAVVFAQAGLGLGIAFESLAPSQRTAFELGLRQLMGGHGALTLEPPVVRQERPAVVGHTAHVPFLRLVQLMISKGILTEAEGKSVLHDPKL